MRQRPAHGARGLGHARTPSRATSTPARSPPSAPSVTRWTVGEPVVAGPSPPLRRVRALPRRATVALRRAAATSGTGDWQGAFARYSLTHEDEVLALPDGLEPARRPRWPSPWRSRCTASPRRGVEPGHRGARHRGRTDRRPHRRRARGHGRRRHRRESSPAPPARHWPAASAPPASSAPTSSTSPACRPRPPRRRARSTSGSSAPATARRWRRRSASSGAAGTLVLVGAGIDAPRFDTNRILLNELVITGAFVYDHDGFERRLELLARQLPLEHLDRARGRDPRRAPRRNGTPGRRPNWRAR